MVWAGSVGKDHVLVRRLRTLTFGLLTPFSFIRAGSTGLTFGSISARFGLSHGIVDQAQYSFLIAAVIGSAVVPTLIANAFFLPRHLIEPEPPAPPTLAVPVPAASKEPDRCEPARAVGGAAARAARRDGDRSDRRVGARALGAGARRALHGARARGRRRELRDRGRASGRAHRALRRDAAIDRIVMGHRGKTFFKRGLLGSVSKQVLHYAHCTATVVR